MGEDEPVTWCVGAGVGAVDTQRGLPSLKQEEKVEWEWGKDLCEGEPGGEEGLILGCKWIHKYNYILKPVNFNVAIGDDGEERTN